MSLSIEDKKALFKAGKYRFKAPPVCCADWDEGDWIVWVTACNGWLP